MCIRDRFITAKTGLLARKYCGLCQWYYECISYFNPFFVCIFRRRFCHPTTLFGKSSVTLCESEAKNFYACPLMPVWATPSCSQPQWRTWKKMMSGQLKPHVSPLLQVHNHMLIEFLVETFRWVKLLVSTWVLPTLVSVSYTHLDVYKRQELACTVLKIKP